MLRSNIDWSGHEIGGVILGVPAREFSDPETGESSGMFLWDGGVVSGVIGADGAVTSDTGDGQTVGQDAPVVQTVSAEVSEVWATKDEQPADEPAD